MAFEQVIVKKSVVGDMRMHILSCTAAAVTEGNIEPGFGNVLGFTITGVSMSTSTWRAFRNIGSTSTALAGYIGISGLVAGDEFQVVCWGT